MPTCYLVGAGEFTPRGFTPGPGDFIIAADGGYAPLQALGVRPHLLVGDFDSLAQRPPDVPIVAFSTHKDDTDMGLALAEGRARGYRRFMLYGAGGGRMDHFLANLQLLGAASRGGADVRMVCADADIFAVTDGVLAVPKQRAGTLVSVFCHGERAEGVTLQGLAYPLRDALLTCDRALGVSNEHLGGEATVAVRRGTLLVFVAAEAP